MIKFKYLIFIILLFSCADKKTELKIIQEKITHFENNEQDLFSEIGISIIRITKNTKNTFQYTLRKKGYSDYAVFQTNPTQIIFENINSNPIDLQLVNKVREFNESNNVVLLNLRSFQNNILIDLKITTDRLKI